MPVRVENDANAAALAEAQWGAGPVRERVLCDDRHRNWDGNRAGWPDLPRPDGRRSVKVVTSVSIIKGMCGCGKRGCIEVFAAGPAIARRARESSQKNLTGRSVVLELAKGDVEAITSETIGQAYKAGDPLATEVLLETSSFLAHWLGNIVDFLEPDVMVIGGGVASMLSPFLDEIKNQLPGCCVNSRCQEIPLVMARYGADAGIAGGGALCALMDQRSFGSDSHISSEAAPKTLRAIAQTD